MAEFFWISRATCSEVISSNPRGRANQDNVTALITCEFGSYFDFRSKKIKITKIKSGQKDKTIIKLRTEDNFYK